MFSRARPRWSQDKLCYARLLRLQGLRGRTLKNVLLKMEFKEAHEAGLLPSENPVPPRLLEHKGPEVDHAWVEGETCSPLFERLTPYERWVCYLLYQEDREDMAEELGVSQRTYERTIRQIRRKLSGRSADPRIPDATQVVGDTDEG